LHDGTGAAWLLDQRRACALRKRVVWIGLSLIGGNRVKMPKEDKLFIECGDQSLSCFRSDEQPDVIEEITTVRKIAHQHDIHLEVLIYCGVASPLSGGRPTEIKRPRVERIARSLNAKGWPFCLAINGGLNFDPTLKKEVLHSLDPILAMLATTGQACGVRNSVVITHPTLFHYIKEEYPQLKTIASCIQALYPFRRHDYGESFRTYDYVVTLNQHATPMFLQRYREYCRKMILFLTLGCGTADLLKCYRHYSDIESEYLSDDIDTTPVNPTLLTPIPCQLEREYRGCDDGALIARETDLIGLLEMGVNKFKIPRNGILSRSNLLKLLQLYKQHGRDGSEVSFRQ
jgi:hypothetical protein